MTKQSSTTSVVGLLTDFGSQDNFVGVMKGVLLSGVPQAKIVDLTHQVPPQNVRFGAFQIMTAYNNFPNDTLFICVVDPGVGSLRKIVYAEADGKKFIAPDNGLLSWIFEEHPPSTLIDISNSAPDQNKVSHTFHGRDIMAPAAVRILKGENPSELGPALKSWEKLHRPQVEKIGTRWEGEILVSDHYGNLITNVRMSDWKKVSTHGKTWIEFQNKQPALRGISTSYADGEPGKVLAVEGSSGFIEIAVRDGNAQKKTGLKEGDAVVFVLRT